MSSQIQTFGGEDAHDKDELKEIKVRIRISQHIKLHRIRLLMEQTLSETVRMALDRYFDDLAEASSTNGRP